MISGFIYLHQSKSRILKIKIQIYLTPSGLGIHFYDTENFLENYLTSYLKEKFNKDKELMPRCQGDLSSFEIGETIWLMHHKGRTTFRVGWEKDSFGTKTLFEHYQSAICLVIALSAFYEEHQSKCSVATNFEQIAFFLEKDTSRLVGISSILEGIIKNISELKLFSSPKEFDLLDCPQSPEKMIRFSKAGSKMPSQLPEITQTTRTEIRSKL